MNQYHRVAIGLGSNLGDRLATIKTAIERITSDILESASVSSIWETPPWGVTDQPHFLNGVVVGNTEWKPPAILNYLKIVERELGRREGVRFGPRVLDLDLLAFGEQICRFEGGEVPHPRLTEREFVLRPLAEVWPHWRHPEIHRTASQLLEGYLKSSPSNAKVFAPPPQDKVSL